MGLFEGAWSVELREEVFHSYTGCLLRLGSNALELHIELRRNSLLLDRCLVNHERFRVLVPRQAFVRVLAKPS